MCELETNHTPVKNMCELETNRTPVKNMCELETKPHTCEKHV